MAIPLIPIAVGAWKVLNIAGNVLFFGQLGRSALKKYQEYKSRGMSDEEIEAKMKIDSAESVQREIDKAKQ